MAHTVHRRACASLIKAHAFDKDKVRRYAEFENLKTVAGKIADCAPV